MIGPNRLVDIAVKEAEYLEASLQNQAEALSHSLWVLGGLVGYTRLNGFVPPDQAFLTNLLYPPVLA